MHSAVADKPVDLDRRRRLRTMLSRRRRFWRSVFTFVIATTVMVLLVLANRDAQQFRRINQEARAIAEALQAKAAETGDLPLLMPNLPSPYGEAAKRYYFNMYYVEQQRWSRPAGVCCSKKPWDFFLRSSGRVVVLYDGDKFVAQWMPEDEFHKLADKLGFGRLTATSP